MILREQKADLWIGSGLLLFCGFAGWRATYIKQGFNSSAAGPSFVPWLVIGLVSVLSVLLIVRRCAPSMTPRPISPCPASARWPPWRALPC